MKIGFIIDDTLDKPDGVQQYVLTLGAQYVSQGHEVHYLCGQSQRSDLPNVHSLSRNIAVRFNGNRLTIPLPANKKAITALLTAEQFDVLHVQMPYSPMLAGRIIKLADAASSATAESGVGRRPVIVGTFHILPISRLVRTATKVLGWWLRPSLRRLDAVYAVSPAAQQFAKQAFGLPVVEVSPNVADVSKFQAAQPFERYDDGVPTLMFLGRLVPRKGCHTFVEAIALLRQRLGEALPFRAVVCGKGPLDAALRQQAEQAGLSDIVEFAGFVSEADKPRYMASADIMAFPSSGGESFGIVLIEAMAAGRPVVLAGNNPGYASVMHERPDLLFPATDAGALADLFETYLRDIAAQPGAASKPGHESNDETRQAAETVAWQKQYVPQFDAAKVGTDLLQSYQRLAKQSIAE